METEIEKNIDQSPFTLVSGLRGKWRDENTKAQAIHPFPDSLFTDNSTPTNLYEKFRENMTANGKNLDVAIIGISSGRTGSFDDILRKKEFDQKKIRRLNFVGEILNRPYNSEGKDLFDSIEHLRRYVDGIELEELQKRVRDGKKVIAIAGGKDKTNAIRVALEKKFLNVLITDMKTATALCGEDDGE